MESILSDKNEFRRCVCYVLRQYRTSSVLWDSLWLPPKPAAPCRGPFGRRPIKHKEKWVLCCKDCFFCLRTFEHSLTNARKGVYSTTSNSDAIAHVGKQSSENRESRAGRNQSNSLLEIRTKTCHRKSLKFSIRADSESTVDQYRNESGIHLGERRVERGRERLR